MQLSRRPRRSLRGGRGGLLAAAVQTGLVAAASLVDTAGVTTTPLPYGGPPYVAPNPYVFWIDSALTPTTTPPQFSQCHGCDCVQLFADGFASAGAIADRFRCAAAPNAVPALKWSGFDDSPGVSFAVTVADLDDPDGVGAMGNRVSALFWAANIPGDWRELSEEKVAGGGVVVGRNRRGNLALEPICPQRGRHRVSLTLWVLRSSLPGVGSDTPYSEVRAQLESAELAHATVFAAASAAPSTQALLELAARAAAAAAPAPATRRLRHHGLPSAAAVEPAPAL